MDIRIERGVKVDTYVFRGSARDFFGLDDNFFDEIDPPGALAIDSPQIRADYFAAKIAEFQPEIKRMQAMQSRLLGEIEYVKKFFCLNAGPIEATIREVEASVHDLFKVARTKPRGAQSRQRIERFYSLIQELLLRPLPPNEPTTGDNEPPELPEFEQLGAEQTQDSNHQYMTLEQLLRPEPGPLAKAELRKLYLKLAALYHPDFHPGSEYHAQMMIEINSAYDCDDLGALLEIESRDARSTDSSLGGNPIDLFRAVKGQLQALVQTVKILSQQEEVEIYRQVHSGLGNPLQFLMTALTSQLEDISRIECLLNDFIDGKLGILKFLEAIESLDLDDYDI